MNKRHHSKQAQGNDCNITSNAESFTSKQREKLI